MGAGDREDNTLDNPSASVITGVKNARKVLTPEGEYYRGKGTNK